MPKAVSVHGARDTNDRVTNLPSTPYATFCWPTREQAPPSTAHGTGLNVWPWMRSAFAVPLAEAEPSLFPPPHAESTSAAASHCAARSGECPIVDFAFMSLPSSEPDVARSLIESSGARPLRRSYRLLGEGLDGPVVTSGKRRPFAAAGAQRPCHGSAATGRVVRVATRCVFGRACKERGGSRVTRLTARAANASPTVLRT